METISPTSEEIRFRYTGSEYRRGMFAAFGRGLWTGLAPMAALGAAVVTLLRLGFPPRTVSYAGLLFWVIVAAVLGAILGAAGQRAVGWISWWYYARQSPDWQVVAVALSPTSIRIGGLGRQIEASWSALRAVEERGGLYVLTLPNRSVHFVPRRALSSRGGIDQAFRAYAREHLAGRANVVSDGLKAPPGNSA